MPTSAWPSAVCAGRYGDLHKTVAVEVERRALAGAEPDLAERHRIVPEFAAVPPISAAKPPGAAVIVPALVTGAEAPLPENARLPDMKSRLVIAKRRADKAAADIDRARFA